MKSHDESLFATAAAHSSRESGVTVTYEACSRYNSLIMAGRFRLPNGLRILLLPDGRAPVFAYQTWFDVGSRDEDPKCTGMAHLCEHLMFKGTAKHPTGELDREMENRGAQTNAATWVDWTCYMQELATHPGNLATLIDFEADRMTGLLLDDITFASELEVVKNERRMSVDNAIGGLLNETLFELAYTKHPYGWSTIGSMAHLEKMTASQVREFYHTYYNPNNAVVSLAGDVDPTEALTLIGQAYGSLPERIINRRRRPCEPLQTEPRQRILHQPVIATQVIVGFHSPAMLDPDFACMEIINDALVGGDSSRLEERLVIQEELASDIEGYVTPFSEPGLYIFSMTLRAGVDPQHALAVLQEELDRVALGLEDWEIDKAKNGLELGLIDGFRDVDGCAEAIGHYEVCYGDFSLAFKVLNRFSELESNDIAQAAQRVFSPSRRNTVIALADGSI